MLIDKKELNDFQSLIKDASLNLSDFELREQTIHLPKMKQEADAGRVIVKSRRTGVERSYLYTQWVIDFNDDLKNGVFN